MTFSVALRRAAMVASAGAFRTASASSAARAVPRMNPKHTALSGRSGFSSDGMAAPLLRRWLAPRPSDTSASTPRGSSRAWSTAGGSGGGSGGAGGGDGGGGGGGGGSGGDGAKAAGIAGLWAVYLKLLNTKPVITKAITSAILNAFGDIMSQVYIEGDHPFDWRRLAQFTSIGFFLVGPTLHYWYLTLSKIVTLQGTSGAALRLALDQLLFAPAFVVVFFSTLCCFELQPQKISPMLRQEWWPAVVTNWKIWVPFQFLNFRLVPQNLQVLTANFIALIWNTYLSYASHRTIEEPAAPEPVKKGRK